ncbi:MAG: transporter [Actinophytocola sp.]|uniref:transporter n=1 Tax=Actinophytocola sp. TaxID=1872138 RepID=UPI003D6A1A6A
MIWLAWRQLRVPAVSVFAGMAAIAVVLAITGPGLVGRTEFGSAEFLYYGGVLAMFALPAIVGIFWGVPTVARELEAGTHSLVWNQTVSRRRWLATKLGIGMLAAMAAAGLLSLAVGWWASPIDAAASAAAADGGDFLSRIEPTVFAVRGIAPVGYAAFAFVLGVAAGIVLRRTLTAMAVTLVAFVAVQVAVPFLVRPYFLPATEETVAITEESIRSINADGAGTAEALTVESPTGVWMLANETVDADGVAVRPLPDAVQDCAPEPGSGPPPKPGGMIACFAQLNDLGYQQHLSYQPGSRFWPLQWLETAMFLALSALLGWFCLRRVRRL